MGIRIDRGAKDITIAGVTSRKMWGDGFYVEDAKNTKFCAGDRRQQPPAGTVHRRGRRRAGDGSRSSATRMGRARAPASISSQTSRRKRSVNIRIQNSKFLNNAGPGIEIAGKRGAVAKVELSRNMFKGNRPILVENAPDVLASAICGNRQVTSEKASSKD